MTIRSVDQHCDAATAPGVALTVWRCHGRRAFSADAAETVRWSPGPAPQTATVSPSCTLAHSFAHHAVGRMSDRNSHFSSGSLSGTRSRLVSAVGAEQTWSAPAGKDAQPAHIMCCILKVPDPVADLEQAVAMGCAWPSSSEWSPACSRLSRRSVHDSHRRSRGHTRPGRPHTRPSVQSSLQAGH